MARRLYRAIAQSRGEPGEEGAFPCPGAFQGAG
jgi:hypothetical protein